jgi:hypothetical protein
MAIKGVQSFQDLIRLKEVPISIGDIREIE